MQLDILKCIAAYVLKNGAVSIPSIGHLYTQLSNPDFVEQDGFLHPPRKTLTFEGQSKDVEPFINHVADVYAISVDRARSIVLDWCDGFKQSLKSGKQVDLPGLGQFRAENSEVVFEPLAANFHQDYLFYPSIPLVPVKRDPVEIEPIKVPTAKIGKVSAIDRVDKSQTTINRGLDISKSNKMGNTNNQRDPYYDDDKGLMSEIGGPLFSIVLLALFAFVLLKTGCFGLLNDSQNVATEIVDDATNTAEDVIKEASDAVSINTPEEKPYSGKYSDVLTQDIIDQGCVIVVGSFKESKNALRMRNKIIAKGYQPFDEYHNDFNRIGIVFDCLEVDLVDFIQDVRRDIDAKAWYRIPGFKVPY